MPDWTYSNNLLFFNLFQCLEGSENNKKNPKMLSREATQFIWTTYASSREKKNIIDSSRHLSKKQWAMSFVIEPPGKVLVNLRRKRGQVDITFLHNILEWIWPRVFSLKAILLSGELDTFKTIKLKTSLSILEGS